MQEALQKRFPDLVALFSALGFLTLLSELLLTGHTEGIQALAPLAAGVGTLAVLAGLWVRGGRSLAVGFLLLVGATGVVGLAQHMREDLGASRPATVQLVDEEGREYPSFPRPGEGGEKETPPPPLAPLALSGLGLLGALALYAREP